jgi:hypothetical protein
MAWFTSGVLVNPAIDAILADTGPAAAGEQSSVKVIIGGSIALIVALEYRNAANTVNVNSQIISSLTNAVEEVELPGLNYQTGERFRLRLVAAVVGSVQGSIFSF